MKLKLFLIGGLALILTGCNIFSWTSKSADDLYYEGIKLFNEKKFEEAQEKLAEAIQEDPLRSDYRYYHAKATIFASEVNFLTVARDIVKPPKTGNIYYMPLYSKDPTMSMAEDRLYKNEIYQIVKVCHQDIDPIFKEKTHGTIKKDDILFEYSLFSFSRAILQFRDINNDGVIDDKDLYFDIFSSSDQLIDYQVIIPPNIDRDSIVDALKNSVIFLGDGAVAMVEVFASEYVDTDKLEEVMDKFRMEIESLIP